MQREGVSFSPHFFQSSLGFTKGFAEVVQCILKPICPHAVQPNINAAKEQFCSRRASFDSDSTRPLSGCLERRRADGEWRRLGDWEKRRFCTPGLLRLLFHPNVRDVGLQSSHVASTAQNPVRDHA